MRRYQDAYTVAQTLATIGAIVKVVSYVIAVVGIGLGALAGADAGIGPLGFILGLVGGAIVAIPVFVLGVLVAALGQILSATLDTAVHTSPFLTSEQMRQVLHLGDTPVVAATANSGPHAQVGAPTSPVEPEDEATLMARYGITSDGEQFHYREYKYTRLSDAIAYARLQE